MNTLNQQSLIGIVNQSGGARPADGIPGDRHSALGNPFHMGKDENLRWTVCDAYETYINTVLGGESPVLTATRIAEEQCLMLSNAWKRPTRDVFMSALAALEQRQTDGKPSKVMCWCARKRCHFDTLKTYLDKQRAQSRQTPETALRDMPEFPARTQ